MSAAQQSIENNLSQVNDGNTNQFLTFILAGQEYGVDILRVREIKGWDRVTPIPNMPQYIRGVINMRGTIVPIIDLRDRFGLETIEYSPMTVVIMLKIEGQGRDRIMGIVVDAVSEVYNVNLAEMKDPPDFGDLVRADFIRGLATVDEKMFIVLDIDQLLNSDALTIAAEVEA